MTTHAKTYAWRASLAWSAVRRATRLLAFGFLAWVPLSMTYDAPLKAVSLIAVAGVAALVGITWYLSRARAERRWQAGLDRHFDRR